LKNEVVKCTFIFNYGGFFRTLHKTTFMFFILSKVLSFIQNPLFWGMVLLIYALITRNIKRRKKAITGVLLLLFFFGNQIIINEIALVRESKWRNGVSETSLTGWDTAVLLGGYAYEWEERTAFSDAGDRFLQALRLYRKGDVNTLILSGGSGSLYHREFKESRAVLQFMEEAQVLPEHVIIEDSSKNTYENAKFVKNQLGNTGRIVLITSAFHMNRAVKVFQKAGFEVLPYATHFLANPKRRYGFDAYFIPNSKSFFYWELIIKEWIGTLVYQLKGYA
jgi:uncharacterized SAM-binding protein YcdF (DUF218 family)